MLAVSRRPPGPKGFLFRPLYGTGERNAADTLLGLARAYGDSVFFRLPLRSAYLLSHPDFIKDVLVTHDRNFVKSRGLQRAQRLLGNGLLTSEGEFHRRQRRLVQPMLARERVASSYASIMLAYAERVSAGWHAGETRDVAEEMRRLTLAIAGKTLFDADVESEAGDISAALGTILDLFPASLRPFSELYDRLPVPRTLRFRRARGKLDAIIYRLIARRRADFEQHDDLLSLLLRARDTEGDGAMTDEQIRDEAMTLFLAGHETTANALTWTFYLLSQHPEVEARLHAEVDTLLADRGPLVDDLPRLEFTAAVLSESMRLYPPAWVIGRRALRAQPVGEYVIPAGAAVLMSPYVVHRDPRFWDDPLRFKPERWLARQPDRPPFAYFPFGGGSRVCIGEWFARTETAFLLAMIARDWRLRLAPGHPVQIQPLITLRPKYGMRMTLEQRATAAR